MELKNSETFDGLVERIWGTFINLTTSSTESGKEYEEYENEDEPTCIVSDIEDTVDANVKLLNQQPAYNKILQSEVSL